MDKKRNLFTVSVVIIFEICAVYALFSGIIHVAAAETYPFLWYGVTLCSAAVFLLLIHMFSNGLWRFNVPVLFPTDSRRSRRIELLIVGAVLLCGAVLRIWVIVKFPITPSSDYETYYQVAVLLSKGTLNSSGYSGYIAEFPHVIGFPFVLSLLFRITGPSVQAGLYLNMAAGLLSAWIVYKIARRLGGRICGLIALAAAAFWPSQILYGSILASEPVFTCLILLCLWLFLYLWKYPITVGSVEGSMFLCILLGVLLALTSAVRPLAEILLVAAVLSLLPLIVRFNKNERMLNGRISRAACQGWFRALIILFSFLVCSKLLSLSISNTIQYQLPGSSISYGYNLMVGVNIDAKGAWNQQDGDFFAEEFANTNSSEDAHRASLGVALQRIRSNPLGVLNLAFEKFTYLWENDDYSSDWTTLFLGQQGDLTQERQDIIDTMSRWNDGIYLLSIFLSALFGLELLRRKSTSPMQVMILLFIGTVLLHMVLESQNRYHYFILPVFTILASMEIAEIYRKYAYSTPKVSSQALKL